MKKILALAFACLAAFAVLGEPLSGLRNPAFLGSLSTLTFDLQPNSGPSNVSSALTLNGVAMTPVFDCDARTISGTSWACATGGTLSEAFTGASPTSGQPTPFTETGALSVAYGGASTKAHQSSGTTLGDLTTNEDVVFEYVFRSTGSNQMLFGKYNAVAAGWSAFDSGWNIYDGTTQKMTVMSHVANVWYHDICFMNRDWNNASGMICYENGTTVANNTANPSTVTNTLSNSLKFTIGAGSGGGTVFAGNLAFVRIWKCTGCLPTNNTENASVAAQRFAQLAGVYPQVAIGSAVPTTMTRASTAMVDLINTSTSVRTLYLVGSNAPRVVRRKEVAGGEFATGYLAEPAATNTLLQSQTLGTTWTDISGVDGLTADGVVAPDGTTTMDGIESLADGVGLEHGRRQAITSTAATRTFSVYASAGTNTFAVLREATIANGAAWFDLAACAACTTDLEDCAAAKGTKQAGVTEQHARRFKGATGVESCRISISYTGTAAAHNLDLLSASADNTLTYTEGVNTDVETWFWGAQDEAQPVATSYIVTTTATVTRAADVLAFAGAGNATSSTGTAEASFLCPSYDVPAAEVSLLVLGVAGSSANRRQLEGASSDAAQFISRDSGGTASATITAGSGDVADGEAHAIRATWGTNDFQAWYDGASTGTDVSGTAPASTTTIFIGSTTSSLFQPACLISRVRSWSSRVAP